MLLHFEAVIRGSVKGFPGTIKIKRYSHFSGSVRQKLNEDCFGGGGL